MVLKRAKKPEIDEKPSCEKAVAYTASLRGRSSVATRNGNTPPANQAFNSSYYVTGGTLHPEAPCYVERQAAQARPDETS